MAARRRALRGRRATPAEKGRSGATLVLRVDGGPRLDVQYKARQIIERINAYFGYAAIAELRIVQAPVEREAAACAPDRPSGGAADARGRPHRRSGLARRAGPARRRRQGRALKLLSHAAALLVPHADLPYSAPNLCYLLELAGAAQRRRPRSRRNA